MRIATYAAQPCGVRPRTLSHFPEERAAPSAGLPLDDIAEAMNAGATIDPTRTVPQPVDNLAMANVDLLTGHQVGQKAMLRAACLLIAARELVTEPRATPRAIPSDVHRKASAAVAFGTRAFVALGGKIAKTAGKAVRPANPLGRGIGENDPFRLRLQACGMSRIGIGAHRRPAAHAG